METFDYGECEERVEGKSEDTSPRPIFLRHENESAYLNIKWKVSRYSMLQLIFPNVASEQLHDWLRGFGLIVRILSFVRGQPCDVRVLSCNDHERA